MRTIQSSVYMASDADEALPRFAFYGDADDHLRVPALLYKMFESRQEVSEGAACVDPRASWDARRDAMRAMLEYRPRRLHEPLYVIENVDALVAGLRHAHEDEQDEEEGAASRHTTPLFARERRELYHALLYNVERGTFILHHTGCLDAEARDMVSWELASERTQPQLDAILADVPVVVRRLVHRLMERGIEDIISVKLMVEACEPQDLTDHLIWTAYGHLKSRERAVLRHVATLRGAQHVNGSLGALAWREHLTQDMLAMFVREGWLVRRGSDVELPWMLRRYLVEEMALFAPAQHDASFTEAAQTLHGRWTSDPATLTDVHYYAREAGDTELAWDTSTYYASDMRALAIRLSQRGDYARAAQIYQRIVEQFDPTDAYAWEYWAFNLERTRKQRRHDEATRRKIEAGYRRAHELSGQ